MLLDEDPATLIANCTSNFHLAPDKSSLLRINSSLSTLGEARSLRLSALQSDLKTLSRRLNTVSSQHAISTKTYNPAEHASEILRLDTEKFRVAKEVTEAESEGGRLEEELRACRRVLEEVEGEGIEGGVDEVSSDQDEILLKLKVYRTLGIDIEQDEASGSYRKAVIRNMAKGDAHVVNVDPKFSRKFYADYFWGTM
ncbi:Spc24-domain-containing protein [Aulographum hederae CBS 113979]|uniref:Kinetochore protein Spc24 n=1 Tax=Aulographum hederae CBS 113979 TaxID=1176131 RepID=A0A6G1HGK1_9PEZI|nr:Spc24-domain-containing protein [Aulographum hederae CBS 113979]